MHVNVSHSVFLSSTYLPNMVIACSIKFGEDKLLRSLPHSLTYSKHLSTPYYLLFIVLILLQPDEIYIHVECLPLCYVCRNVFSYTLFPCDYDDEKCDEALEIFELLMKLYFTVQ